MQTSAVRPDHEPLSRADTAWYRLESPDNPVDIAVLLTFDGPVDFDLLKKTVGERLLRYRRFRQRIVESKAHVGTPAWEDDPSFSLDRHVRRVPLGDATLPDRIGALLGHPLPMDRPLWEMLLVEASGGGNTLVARLHHCIADGFALVRVMLGMADDAGKVLSPGDGHDPAHASLGHRLLEEAGEIRHHPSHVRSLATGAGRTVASLTHLVTMPYDRDSLLRKPLTGRRRVAWSSGIPLARVKEIGHRIGGTVNDVLMSALTGAVRRELELGGDALREPVRAIIPVNLRPVRSIEEMQPVLGNRFGLVFLDLPVHVADPAARLVELKRGMDAIKKSRDAVAAFGILTALGASPGAVESVVSRIFARKGSLVATNVPGPKQPLWFAGREITGVMFWVPHPAKLGLGLSILSYAGKIAIGVRTDVGVHSDPGAFVRAFEEEMDALEIGG